MRLLLLPSLLLLSASPVAAQSQSRMTQDAGDDAESADAAMNAQWRQTNAYMKRLDAQNGSRGGGFGYAAALLASQRAWLKYRDTQCVMSAGQYAGGSAQPMVHGQCIARMTRARTQELKDLMWQR